MISKRGKGKKTADYGITDYHRFFNKTQSYKVSKKVYSKIVSELNMFIRDFIVENAIDVTLPAKMGELGIRKSQRVPKIVDGKVINNAPPDWGKTLKLWKNNEEARINKITIKHNNSHTGGFVFRAYYKKGKANYKNKSAYYFDSTRDFKRNITKRINDYTKDKYDSILLYKKN